MSRWVCYVCKEDLEEEMKFRTHLRSYSVPDWLIQHSIELIKFEIRHEEEDAKKKIE